MPYPLVITITGGNNVSGEIRASRNIAEIFAGMGKEVLLVNDGYDGGVDNTLDSASGGRDVERLLGGKFSADSLLSCDRPGILTLPLLSTITSSINLSTEEKLSIFSGIENLSEKVNVVIIDTGAVPPGEALFLYSAAHHIVVTVSPSPTSIKSALRFMAVMFREHKENSFNVIVNGVSSEKVGLKIFGDLSIKAEKSLNVSVDYLGCILKDEYTQRAALLRRPVVELFPNSRPGRSFAEIAAKINELSARQIFKGGMQFFWRQLIEAGMR